uniref:Uncharacterized protein n=1 Tax=Magallana gigas TaxID=29159 RepID=K1QFJ6_MAGGI
MRGVLFRDTVGGRATKPKMETSDGGVDDLHITTYLLMDAEGNLYVGGNISMELMCEIHDGCELLPLYCMDCDCPICSHCITSNHVGHKFQNVSEVVESKLRQLEESLGNEHAVLRLHELLSDSENRQKQLAEHRENLLRNVVDREEEIIEKVKLWREKMTEKIINFTDNEEKMLGKDTTLASALLKCKERNLEIGREDIAVDRCGNILVSVPNDNAIHLLDKTLTFKKLLMTEEDCLHRPTAVALDAEGYLCVGCENGQIHVVNYQCLLNTNRLRRLKFPKISSNDSSLNFPGHFCQKTFDEILKNYDA